MLLPVRKRNFGLETFQKGPGKEKMSNVIKYFLFLVLLSHFFSTCLAASGETIGWHSYNTGMEQSTKEQKKVFLHFFATWCSACKEMKSRTFQDPQIINYLNQHYIPIIIDSDKNKELAKKYRVRGLPTTWFLTHDKKRISGLPGFIEPKRMLRILKYIATDSYRKMPFNEFKKAN